ncbi:hypothetical protein GEMRC1_000464 [Eukaryota sp. GEM-RC1]
MTILSTLFPKFLQSTLIESLPELVCSPKTFCKLSTNILPSHVLWFTSNLVSSYKNSNWNVEEFESCFYSSDFSSTPINQLVQVLGPLKSEKELKRFLLEFNSLVIVPKLIQISEEQRVENLNLRSNISDLCRSHSSEVKNLRESFESRISALSNRVSSLQSEKELELSQSQELFQNLKNGISKLEVELKSRVCQSVFYSVKNDLASTKQKCTVMASRTLTI